MSDLVKAHNTPQFNWYTCRMSFYTDGTPDNLIIEGLKQPNWIKISFEKGAKEITGMVQANVGQKLVKGNKITSFHWCPKLSSGHCSNKYKRNTTTTPPYVILITNPPQQIIYSP